MSKKSKVSDGNQPKINADFEVIRVQTMRDNAIRITLEMPEHMIPQMGMFAECQRRGIYLHGVFTVASIRKAEVDTDGNGLDFTLIESG